MALPQVSVVVCTHNRASLLRGALASVACQTLEPSRFEVLVVDNASTDDTRAVFEVAKASIPGLRLVPEPNLGLAHARNAGWRAAQAPIIAFLDDDAVADPDWLGFILSAFDEPTRPGSAGGRIDPLWEGSPPSWLGPDLLAYLAVVDLSPVRITSWDRPLLAGANAAFRRDLLEEYGGFDPSLDRVGKRMLSNGDTGMCMLLQQNGHPCVYEPRARVDHRIDSRRLTKRWFETRMFYQGVSDVLTLKVLHPDTYSKLARRELRDSISQVLRWRAAWLGLLWTGNQPNLFSARCKVLRTAGFAWGLRHRG
jgi:glycosyltransferase involved in cell wall biosynthesis